MSTPATTPEPSLSAAPTGARRASRPLAGAHLAVPGLLTVAFAFRAGGFFPLITGVGALALCLLLVGRVTLPASPFAGWSRAAAIAALGGAAYASWTLLSALWSHAPERAMTEFDRALMYTLLLTLMATFPRRPGDLDVVLRWVLAAFVCACVAGLASRLAPDVFPIGSQYEAERLSFPLTYWNAVGLVCALATVLALHHGSSAQGPRWVRVLATAALPITAPTLYFSFSRGGMAVCAVGLVAYVMLAPSRRLLFTLATAAAPVAVAGIASYRAGALAGVDYFHGAGPHQGHRVALVLAVCVLAAGALRAAVGPLERRVMRRAAPRLSRGATAGVVAVVVLLAAGAAVVAGAPGFVSHQIHTFASGQLLGETGDARDRLLSGSSNGRLQFWQASLHAFERHPLHGTGAGTFKVWWEQHRPLLFKINDGHSLYLEVLGELGIVGLVALLLLVLTPVVVALTRLRGPRRQAYAAFVAASLVLLIHAGVDWDWEMPAAFAWFFGASGVVLARRARSAGAPAARGPGRLTRILAGLACLLLAITPALVADSQSKLNAAFTAFRDGDCPGAVDAALGANETLPRAAASEIIAYCDLRAGQNALAVRAMEAAGRRDPQNWQYQYGLSIAQAISGKPALAAARRALALDPLEPEAQSLARAMRSRSAKRRYAAAAHATIPSE